MELIKCEACGKEISAQAASCPGCGQPVAKTGRRVEVKKKRPTVFYILAGFFFLMALVSLDAPPTAPQGPGMFIVFALIAMGFAGLGFVRKKRGWIVPPHLVRCPNCGYEGPSKLLVKGSGGVELVLWLFLIVPGLVYSAWRMSNKVKICPDCLNEKVVRIV